MGALERHARSRPLRLLNLVVVMALLAALFILHPVAPALADYVIAQEQESFDRGVGDYGQSFTTVEAGRITRIELIVTDTITNTTRTGIWPSG